MKTLVFFIFTVTLAMQSHAKPTTKKEQFLQFKQGIRYFEEKKYDLAEIEFNKVLKSNPKSAVANFNLGLTKYKMGHYPEAIKIFDTVTKMPTYYVAAAYYYKSIAQLNLGQTEDALKTANQYKKTNFFYQPLQKLIAAIVNGTDEHFEYAEKAAADGNYELCLLEMNQSVLSDTHRGKELMTKCLVDLKQALSKDAAKTAEERTYYKLYFDSYISQTDNVYQRNSNKLGKQVYFAEAGGEYLFKNTIDAGLGFNYNHLNAIDLSRFKAETIGLSIPVYYRLNTHYFGISAIYDLYKYVDENSYSDSGVSVFYSYLNKKNYRLGFIGSTKVRTSIDNEFDYKAGTLNYYKVYGSYFINRFTISANFLLDQSIIGDLQMGSHWLPYANDTFGFGLGVSYDFDGYSVLSLRHTLSVKDYVHIFPGQADRKDDQNRSVLTYHYMFNKNIKAFVQQSLINNKSNYDEQQFINKNYDENITTIGFSLLSY